MNVKPRAAAHNPVLGDTSSVMRPLTNKEALQRSQAICVSEPSPKSLPCSGQLFIGLFFDGTGNNEKADYVKFQDKPGLQQHSNVVRLYHMYPDQVTKGATKYYRYYVPGVGTNFPEINDSGGTRGTGAGLYSEDRIIWGLMRIFNAVSDFITDIELFSDKQAGNIANSLAGSASTEGRRISTLKGYWGDRLKALITNRPKNTPKPELITLSVYGFSRGAAQARGFVNWLYQLCDEAGGGHTFCGIPLRLQFLGIFDTVAAIGVGGGFTSGAIGSEGRQSWAKDNLQIHKAVESCLHFVAAHEVRGTFPVDSVRVDGAYPSNVKEYVYPGSHSDVGGGYAPGAYGKTDALARIPGYEMYKAALKMGVPFHALYDAAISQGVRDNMRTRGGPAVFNAYMSAAQITEGPVEDMMRQHMAQYFRYRYQARNDSTNNKAGSSYISRAFFKRAGFHPDGNRKSGSDEEQEYIRDTQQYFIAILAAVSVSLDRMMAAKAQPGKALTFDKYIRQPFAADASNATMPDGAEYYKPPEFDPDNTNRAHVITDSKDTGERDKRANRVYEKVTQWRKWLAAHNSPDLADPDAPERDVLSVIETLNDIALDKTVVDFFDDWVHDSMAGLAKDNVPEFLINGIGLAKFRRVFFGNNGDTITRDAVKAKNAQQTAISAKQRAAQAEKAKAARKK